MIKDIEGAKVGLKAFVQDIIKKVNGGTPFYLNDLDKTVLEFVPDYENFSMVEKTDFGTQVLTDLQEFTGVQDFGFPAMYSFYMDTYGNTIFYLSRLAIINKEFKKHKIPLTSVRPS